MTATANGRAAAIGERARDAAVNAGQQIMSGLEWWLLRSSEIPTTPFLEAAAFPWSQRLSGRWPEIRAELEQVLGHRAELPNFQDILRDVAPISRDDRWKTYFFRAYGYRSEPNCARCPATSAALAEIPGLVTAFFSILAPGKRIPPHRGPYRGVVRCHLGLMVPDPPQSCGISVGGEVRHWREGEVMFFDDGYEHFAWNDSDRTRAVLFLDIVRPLRPPAARVNRALLRAISASPFLRDARRRHRAWEGRFESLARLPAGREGRPAPPRLPLRGRLPGGGRPARRSAGQQRYRAEVGQQWRFLTIQRRSSRTTPIPSCSSAPGGWRSTSAIRGWWWPSPTRTCSSTTPGTSPAR